MFSWFQKKNNQQSDSLNPKNLPEDLLVQALFENAILQAQNFVGRLRHGKQLSLEAQNKIASQIVEYAFAIMVFYLESAGKGGLKQKIMQKHEMFLMDNCGTNNSESRAQFLEAWRQEIKRKVQWLSLGNDTINLDNNCFAQSIISDPEFNVDMHNSELLPYIEQFVSDVVLSMKHFGIKNATLDFQKQFEIRDLPSAQSKIKAPSLDNNKLETSKKKREKNGWVWILFGLFCMYFIGMIVVFNDSKSSIPIHYKILGEMVELSGFVVPLLPLILIFTAAGVIPFLFFKKTRQWKMPVYIFLIISGWQYGGIMAGNFYLNFIEMKISNSRILAFGILFLYLTVFVSVPIITIQWLRNNKCKYILWLLPLAFLYVGLKINVQMHPMPDFNSTLKPHSLIHLEGGLRDRISKDVITLVKGNSDTKEITRDIEGVILSPAVSSTDADMIFKENSKAVVVVTAYDKKGNTIGLGSGFFVRADGAVVTNYHVIGMASDIKVTAGDKVLDVEGLIFSDEKNDLVILKAKARNMPVVKLGVVGKANIGEHVYVIGYPLGLKTISVGLLSGIDIKREILQTTAPASPGSSGSPVFDRNSEVIGVASGSVLLPGEVRNYSFAMPVKLIKNNINNKQVTAIKRAGLEGYKKTAWYWYFLGRDYGKSGRYKKAIKAYKKMIRIDPDFPFAHSSLGMAYYNSGKYEQAIEAWKQMIGTGLDLADAHYNLGLSYYKSGMYKEAIDSYMKTIKISPNYAMAHYNLAFAYNDLGMYKEGIDANKRAIRINPDNANFYNNLGAAYVISGMYSEAIKEYNQAIRICPDDTNVHYNLGQAYGKLGKYKEAIEAWRQAIRIDHDNANAHNDLGVAYIKLGMNKEAIQAWKQAIRIDPNDASTHYFIGRAYALSGMIKEAIQAWKQAIKIDPDNVSAHFCLGVFAKNRGSAIEQYEILKSLDPELANQLFERIYKKFKGDRVP